MVNYNRMSSLAPEELFFTTADGSAAGLLRVDSLRIREIICDDLTVTNGLPSEGQKIYSGGSVNTSSATPVILYTMNTSLNRVYLYEAKILASSGASVAIYKKSIKGKNLSGVVSIGAEFDIWDDSEGPLADFGVIFEVSGSNVLLKVVGGATSVSWSGVVIENSKEI